MMAALVLVFVFLSEAVSVAVNVCYVLDETNSKATTIQQERVRLLKNISQCLVSEGTGDIKAAMIAYDDKSARLGFNFQSIRDVLNGAGFEKVISKQTLQRDTSETRRNEQKSFTIRVFGHNGGLPATNSPQSVAFLTAAEAVVAAESQSTDSRGTDFKVLVISHSDVFPIIDNVGRYFLNASVEINAVDLSSNGNSELMNIVTAPVTKHYFHPQVFDEDKSALVRQVCETLLKAPLSSNAKPFFKASDLLTRPLKEMMSSSEGSPQYEYQALAADGNEYSEGNTDLDGSIERASSEYEWSPHPEFESVESEGNPQDTPEELYSAEDKKDICRYLYGECSKHMQAGLCVDENPQAQGMRKFCKTTCKFCV